MKLDFKSKLKKGFIGMEYCVIGAVVILGCLAMFRVMSSGTKANIEGGANGMSDDPGVTFINSSGSGHKITGLEVIPNDLSLRLGETKKVTTMISPSNIWNYQLEWYVSTADQSIIMVEPSSGSTEANITGLSEGKALVSVKTTDGSELSRDIIVRVGYPVTEFTIVGERVFASNTIGILDAVFADENVSWENKTMDLVLLSEYEFGGPGVDTVGNASLQTKVADFVITDNGRIVIYPNQGGTIRFSVIVTDHTFETSYTATVDISIQAYYYRYRDLSDWSDWSTEKVEGEYNEQKTQYGYQDVSKWKDEFLETKPIDGFYNPKTQYGYQEVDTWDTEGSVEKPVNGYYKEEYVETTQSYGISNNGITTDDLESFQGPGPNGYSKILDLGTAIYVTKIDTTNTMCHTHVGTRTWYGSNDGNSWTELGQTKTSKGSVRMESTVLNLNGDTAYRYYRYRLTNASAGYARYDGAQSKCTGTGSTGEGYEQFFTIHIEGKVSVLNYYPPKTWKDAVWSATATSTFKQTTSLKPLIRTAYQSPEEWGEIYWSETATTSYASTQYRKALSRKLYRYKTFGKWSEWFMCDISGCPESTSTRQVETKIGV